MSGIPFDLLKKKPAPQKKKPVKIQLPEKVKKVSLDVKIQDKQGTIAIDRSKLLLHMKMAPTKKIHDAPKTTPQPKKLRKLKKTGTPKMKPRKLKKLKIATTKPDEEERLTIPIQPDVLPEEPITMLEISDEKIQGRLPKKSDQVVVRVPQYFMNNRNIFSEFINGIYRPYREEVVDSEKELSCATVSGDSDEFELMTHQKIVRDYINNDTPYRGLLLFHGLGSGKTCTSIAVAEGMKNQKQVYIFTPASLRMNYVEEIKKCGDLIYRKNQHWEFKSVIKEPEYMDALSSVLGLTKEFIAKNKGAWLVDANKKPNFESLSQEEAQQLDIQINKMIENKYKFIHYNGINMSKYESLTKNFTINPFDNSVIIVDEAHNFVSRIVNKLKKEDSLSYLLYDNIMAAENARVVFLTGTPVINYPNEIGILFNMLRGYIKTWSMKLNIGTGKKIIQKTIEKKLAEIKTLDFIDYKPSTKDLIITRNPHGFFREYDSKEYKGVYLNDSGQMSDDDFINHIKRTLAESKIEIIEGTIQLTNHKALPDTLDEFKSYFINASNGNLKNEMLLKRRILGLTSYYHDKVELMPRYNPETDFKVVKIPMSDYQFGIYEQARVEERKLERSSKKKRPSGKKDDLYSDTVSTYRIFSRAFCNFVFPRAIQRPLPQNEDNIQSAEIENLDEDIMDATPVSEKLANPDGTHTVDDEAELEAKIAEVSAETYPQQIVSALEKLQKDSKSFLSKEALQTYSPKFLNMLENLEDERYKGLHMMYTQFRTLEGIGVFKLVLEENGFTQFKIRQQQGEWVLDIEATEFGKPMFALYTGTETPEEKEIIRNVFNSTWEYVPKKITEQLLKVSMNNHYGEIIKLLMITASGAEGISLKNVRYVHITEPYWHPARTKQVVGRARRICSHEALPEAEQTVEVFQYLMTFSEEQLASDASIELQLKDKSKVDKTTPVSSDETLYEISVLKEEISKQLLTAVKESAIDCAIHSKADAKEPLVCYSVSGANSNTFSSRPSYQREERDKAARANKKVIEWEAKEMKAKGKRYALNPKTMELFDYDSYILAKTVPGNAPLKVGELIKNPETKKYTIKLNVN